MNKKFGFLLIVVLILGVSLGFVLNYKKAPEVEPKLENNQVTMVPVEENLKNETIKNNNVKYVKTEKQTKKVYYIQLGAFLDPNNSQRLLEKVKQMGYAVRLKEIKYKENLLIAVQVGPFVNHEKAREHTEVLFSRLSDEEISQVFISHYLVTE